MQICNRANCEACCQVLQGSLLKAKSKLCSLSSLSLQMQVCNLELLGMHPYISCMCMTKIVVVTLCVIERPYSFLSSLQHLRYFFGATSIVPEHIIYRHCRGVQTCTRFGACTPLHSCC